jgi:hypothetical protein
MYRDAYRDDNGGHRHSYWRRRLALAAGLILLGLLVWAAADRGKAESQAPRNLQASGTLQAVAGHSAPVSPSAPANGTEPALASPAMSPSLASPAGSPSLASPAGSPSLTSAAASQSVADPGPEGSCPPSAVVLSLFSSRPSYSIGQDPRFAVYVVSTAPGTCTFDFGHGGLHLTVMWAGRIIWDSADCARTDAIQVERLSRGVPVQESITWNRTITLPGCIEVASSARPGTYEVQARTATGASQVRTFNLR